MSIIFVMQGKCLFSDISRPESGVAKMAWDVMSGVTKMAWDVMSGVTKTAWDVLSGVANLCGMFCPGCKKMAWDVLSRDVLSGSRIFN